MSPICVHGGERGEGGLTKTYRKSAPLLGVVLPNLPCEIVRANFSPCFLISLESLKIKSVSPDVLVKLNQV